VFGDAKDDQRWGREPATEELLIDLCPPVIDTGMDGVGAPGTAGQLVELKGGGLPALSVSTS
jgi:hypothetical protein